MQPNKDQTRYVNRTAHGKARTRRQVLERDVKSGDSSLVPILDPRERRLHDKEQGAISFDEPVREGSTGLKVEFDHTNDNASTAPLFSHCSSSVKSSIFSDSTSMQSTRATVFSNKTFDTNSSTVGIPPASILDRARHTSAAAQGAASIFSLTTTHHTSQANSIRQYPLYRNNSTHTVNTTATVASQRADRV